MTKKLFVFLFVVLFLSSCAIQSQPGEETGKESPGAPTHVPIVENNTAPVINRFTTEIGSLCSGKQTKILFSVSDPDEDKVEIYIEAEYGEIIQDGETYIYLAPETKPEARFDTLTLQASDQDSNTKRSIPIMLITHESTLEWEQTAGPEGGAINSIEIVPSNPDVLYAGGEGGRLIKTTNGGESWETLPEFIDTAQTIQEIILDPANEDTLYIRTWRLFKTEDGGNTFRDVSPPLDGFSDLDINRENTQQLLASNWQGNLYITDNGGNSWRQLPLTIPGNSGISAVAIASETEFWAGTRSWESEFVNFGALYHTTDGGTTWEEITNAEFVPESSVRTIMVPSNQPNSVYVGLMDSNNEPWDVGSERYFLKSTDGGNSWNRITLGEKGQWVGVVDLVDQPEWDDAIYVGSGGHHIFKSTNNGEKFNTVWIPGNNGDMNDLAVDPRDSDVLYLPTQSYGILKSTNGGQSWKWINNGLHFMGLTIIETNRNADTGVVLANAGGGGGQFISRDYGDTWAKVSPEEITHPWGDEFKINPHNPKEYWYVADISETFVSEDEGQTWDIIMDTRDGTTGFRSGSTYAIAAAPSNPKVIYAQKNGFGIFRTIHYEGTQVYWNFLHESDIDYTFSIEVHPEDENIVYSGSVPKPFEDFAMIRKTKDGGATWDTVLNVPKSAGVTAITFANNSSSQMYAASTGASPAVFFSYDSGDTWAKLSFPFNLWEKEIESVEYIEIIPFPRDENLMFLSAFPGGIYFTADRGKTWNEMGAGLPEFTVADGIRQGRYNLAFSQSDGDIFYVAIYNEGIYKSVNWGASWELTSPETTELGILSLAIDPNDQSRLYLGTRAGMFRSEDGGYNWSKLDNGQHFADTDVRTLEFGTDGTLYAGTLGYEIFALFPGENKWVQLNPFGNFGTFWPIWDGRPLYQYTFLSFHPTDPEKIMFATFPAGIYISEDGGKTWQESNTNFSWDGVFSLYYHPENSDIIYSGTYNGVNRSTDGGKSWEMWDQGWAAEQWVFSIDFDPNDPNVMYAVSKNGENRGQGQPGIFMGAVMKSENGGETWFEIMRGLPRDNEYYKIIVDPYMPDVLYLASQSHGIFISYDKGQYWDRWNEGLTSIVAGTNGNNVTNTMALSPDGVHIYFASAGAGAFRRMTVSALEVCGCTP